MNNTINICKSILTKLYTVKKLSANKIGQIYKCSKIPILRLLKLYNITLRTRSENAKLKKLSKKTKNKISNTLKGRPSPNKGKHLSEGWKEKISKSLKGRKITKQHRERIRIALRKRIGKLCPTYIDGRSYIDYSNKFKKLRKEIIMRDNYTCQLCFVKYYSKSLEVHHKDINKYNDNKNNLMTLCIKCHQEIHSIQKSWRAECQK